MLHFQLVRMILKIKASTRNMYIVCSVTIPKKVISKKMSDKYWKFVNSNPCNSHTQNSFCTANRGYYYFIDKNLQHRDFDLNEINISAFFLEDVNLLSGLFCWCLDQKNYLYFNACCFKSHSRPTRQIWSKCHPADNQKCFKNWNELHWSSVKDFSCPKAIDFAPEAGLKFWPIYMKSIPCSNPQYIRIFGNGYGNGDNLSRFLT